MKLKSLIKEYINEEMVGNEKLADDLGQILFRLDTLVYTLSRHTDKTPISGQCVKSIQSDLEKLKEIKSRILAM